VRPFRIKYIAYDIERLVSHRLGSQIPVPNNYNRLPIDVDKRSTHIKLAQAQQIMPFGLRLKPDPLGSDFYYRKEYLNQYTEAIPFRKPF